MNVKINSHSSIQIDDNIYFDPFNIKETEPKAKIIFITHTHFDHFSPDDIKKIATNETVIVTTKDNTKAENLPHSKIIYTEPLEEFEIENVKVKTIPAYNTNKNFHPKNNNWVGYVVTINETSYLVAGDTDATNELKAEKPDVLIIPIGGTYTMTATEAAKLANKVSPKVVIPSHYNSIVGNKTDEQTFLSLLDKNITCEILIK